MLVFEYAARLDSSERMGAPLSFTETAGYSQGFSAAGLNLESEVEAGVVWLSSAVGFSATEHKFHFGRASCRVGLDVSQLLSYCWLQR
jgi:hypothetical protein